MAFFKVHFHVIQYYYFPNKGVVLKLTNCLIVSAGPSISLSENLRLLAILTAGCN